MNTNVAFLGLLFLLYTSGEINSTQLLLLLALISASNCNPQCTKSDAQSFSKQAATATTFN